MTTNFDPTKHIPPNRVFLQHDYDEGFPSFTWCDHQIHDDDLEYIPLADVMELVRALDHLHHNAKASGAEMGLGLDVAQQALANFKQKYGEDIAKS